ncbi:MAG TPA: GNAT family N-acetyltransferase [Ktedonobacterales bacterium]|jgi:GNAT superfamily N-acetyltransferase
MTMQTTRETIDHYWAATFGCQPADLYQPNLMVVRHVALQGYQGAYLFRRGPSCVMSVPEALVEAVSMAVRGHTPDEVFDPQFLVHGFGSAVGKFVGPTWQGYADSTDFQAADSSSVRQLGPSDEAILRGLEGACGEAEWEQSGLDPYREPLFGAFLAGGELAAAGTAEIRDDPFLDVGVLTHPAYRNHGHGRAIVCAATEYGLGQGHIMHFQALRANLPALALARALGYQEYAATLAVRLSRI